MSPAKIKIKKPRASFGPTPCHRPARPCWPSSQHPLTISDENLPRYDPSKDLTTMHGARMSFLVRPKRPRVVSKCLSLALLPRRYYSNRILTRVDKGEEDIPYEAYPKGWRPPASIAVLGGGLTGLTTAHRLARLLPKTKITIYESSSRLGGWVDTQELKDDQGRSVFFERGARMVQVPRVGSLKMDDVPFYHLVRSPACPFCFPTRPG